LARRIGGENGGEDLVRCARPRPAGRAKGRVVVSVRPERGQGDGLERAIDEDKAGAAGARGAEEAASAPAGEGVAAGGARLD
jgi:hypothetical protein